MASNIVNFFSGEDEQKIVRAIKLAEKQTSGEIRVHLENFCPRKLMNRAALIFEKLEMHHTKERNGVLIYIAIRDRKFAIIGDAGINALVEEGYWDLITERLGERFRNAEFVEGLTEAIESVGQKLKTHFQYSKDDVDELSNEISYEETN